MSLSYPGKTWSLIARIRLGLALLFIPVLLLGAVYYLHMERTLRQEQENNLIARNAQFFHSILTPYLANLERQFTLMYQQVDYEDFSGKTIRNGAHYLQAWQTYHQLMELEYVYVGTEQRQILIHPSWSFDEQFDPRARPWYQLAASQPGHMVWTDPYYDYGVGTLTMTLARVIEDPQGRRVGVLSLDTRLTSLSSNLNNPVPSDKPDRQGYQMLINHEGLLLAHPQPNKLFQPLANPQWLAQMTSSQGFFLDQQNGVMVAYHRLPEQRWILLSVIPTAGLNEVIDHVSLNVLGMIALASILYLLLALRWSRDFRRMLAEISNLIRASLSGGHHWPKHRMSELATIYAEMEAASKVVENVRQQANQDKLTDLYNRRFFDECLLGQLVGGHPVGLVMFDLDNFKQINDTFGHQTGDVVLKRVSKLGMTLFNEWGWFCRYGGEELVLILRDQSQPMLPTLLETFRLGVAQLEWREPGLAITISGGVAFSQPGMSAKELVELADKEVYRAKREGKNRICFPLGHDAHQSAEQEALAFGEPQRQTSEG